MRKKSFIEWVISLINRDIKEYKEDDVKKQEIQKSISNSYSTRKRV